MDCVIHKDLYIKIWQISLLQNNYFYMQFAGGKMHYEEISHVQTCCLILVCRKAGVNTCRQYLYCKGRVILNL